MPELCVGLDVSVEATALCVVDARDEALFETSVAGTPVVIDAVLARYRRRLTVVGLAVTP